MTDTTNLFSPIIFTYELGDRHRIELPHYFSILVTPTIPPYLIDVIQVKQPNFTALPQPLHISKLGKKFPTIAAPTIRRSDFGTIALDFRWSRGSTEITNHR